MKSQTALIRSDRAVELHAIPFIDMYFILIVHPRHAEQDHAFGLDEALQKRGALVFGVARNNGFEAR